jgi:2-polyprenyl-3-methyl-5-hydroxy-6-metoxy-1,4-benzoquinol methylase
MSNTLWAEVAALMDSHAYMTGVERTVERVASTGEVFTPTELVVEMLRSQPFGSFGPGKTVLDPACGDGQFLVAVKCVKMLLHGMTEVDALAEVFGVDIMRDNVNLCRLRLGGGTILMGDTLNPQVRLAGQTDIEHRAMIELFDVQVQPQLLLWA